MLKTKVDVSRIVAITCVRLKQISNCLRHNQRCHPRKKQQQKLLILIRLSQLCLRSLTRIAQMNLFQRPRIPRPKIIPSWTRRLLKSHAQQILVSRALKKVRIFQPNWMTLYSWLEYDSEHKFMYCKLCTAAKKENGLCKSAK